MALRLNRVSAIESNEQRESNGTELSERRQTYLTRRPLKSNTRVQDRPKLIDTRNSLILSTVPCYLAPAAITQVKRSCCLTTDLDEVDQFPF